MMFTKTLTTHAAMPMGLRALPVWPMISIVLLLVMAVVFPPGFMTGMNLVLLFLAGIVWVVSGKQFDRTLLRAIAPFIAIVAIGLAGGIGADWYLYLKDAWYVSNPAILLCAGYVFYRNALDCFSAALKTTKLIDARTHL